MKNLKYLFISVGVLTLLFIVYFASQISATYPPLEEYYLNYSIADLKAKLRDINSKEIYNVILTDSTGTEADGFSFYLEIQDEENQKRYHIKYQVDKPYLGQERIKLELVGVFDKKAKTGGYRRKDKDVENLIKEFEREIYIKLRDTHANKN